MTDAGDLAVPNPDMRSVALWRFYGIAVSVFAAILAATLVFWNRPGAPLGVAVGFAAGLLPVASWHGIAWYTDSFQRRRLLAVGLTLVKYAVIGAGLWLALRKGGVDLMALLAGFSAITLSLALLALVGGIQPPGGGKPS